MHKHRLLGVTLLTLLTPLSAAAQSLFATAQSNPTTLKPGDWALVTVQVTPAGSPASTGLNVKADFTAFGRSFAQDLFDNGQYGDAVAGDNIFTYRENLASNLSLGTKTVTATVRDDQGRSYQASFQVNIVSGDGGGTTTPTPIAVTPTLTPTSVYPTQPVLITARVTPGSNPTSTSLTVQANLSSIGRSSTQALNDAGSSGDQVAGDGIYSFSTSATSTTTVGAKTIAITARDGQSRTTSANASLTVVTAPALSASWQNPASTAAPGATVLLVVDVQKAQNPVSTSIGVTGNLAALGGSKSQRFRDNGLNGDAVANDGKFSFRMVLPSTLTTGSKSITASILDAQGRSASAQTTFTVQTATPTNPFGQGGATPNSGNPGQSTLLYVDVTPGTNPASTGITVQLDATALGLGSVNLLDDGLNGDVAAGDRRFSRQATVPSAVTAGSKTLTATVRDGQSRTSTASFNFTVTTPDPVDPPTDPSAPHPLCAGYYVPLPTLLTGFTSAPVTYTSRPQRGIPLRDPVHGTCVIRATDHAVDPPSGFARNDYSRRQAFNADNTYFFVFSQNGFWHLYNANTFQYIRVLPNLAGDAEPQWHPTNPKLLYYITNSGGMDIFELNVDTGTSRSVADFRGKLPWADVARVWTKSEGAPSADGRYWCLMAETSNFAIRGVFVYDLVNQTVVGTRSMTARPDHTGMSASGRWCITSHLSGSGGTVAWSRDFTTSRLLHATSEHSDLALNAEGDDIYVAVDYQANAGDFFIFNIDKNVRTNLFPTYLSGVATAYHVSGRAFNKRGWVLVSTYASNGERWYSNRLFAVELKANPRIIHLGHHQSQFNGYWTEPHAVVNKDFTRLLWSSNWGTTSDIDVDAYFMYLDPALIPTAQP